MARVTKRVKRISENSIARLPANHYLAKAIRGLNHAFPGENNLDWAERQQQLLTLSELAMQEGGLLFENL